MAVIYGESSCMVQVTGVKISSGAFAIADWDKKIKEGYRPPHGVSNPLAVTNGTSHTGLLSVNSNGTVSVKNMGASGSDDARSGSVCRPVQRRY